MNLLRWVAVWTVVVGVAAGNAGGANWYVATNGSDASAGTSWGAAKQTIQAAVDVAASGDTILITSGVYGVSSSIAVTKPLALSGVGGREAVVVDAQEQCGVFWVTNAGTRIEGMTIRRGGGGAAGVYAESSLVLSNCVITGCTNSGVYLVEGGTVQNCLISSNRSPDNAGGIGGASIVMADSQVVDNWCHNQGGGVNAEDSTFSNCLFEGNVARLDGGGLLCNGGTIEGCTLRNNRADGSQGGGGAYLAGVIVEDCTIVGNVCSNISGQAEGGGILLFNSLANNCEVSGNYSAYGGGISCYDGVAISNCVIRYNHSNGSGGGVWMDHGGILRNSLIKDNIANGYGGGVSLYYGGQVTDCQVLGNWGIRGGGISSYHTGQVTRCVVAGNTASGSEGGGGIHFWADSSTPGGYVTNSLIYGNQSKYNGGGVMFYRGGRVENCTIADNTAAGSGGGAYGNTRGQLLNSIVYHNSSDYAGTLSFTNCCTTPLPAGSNNIAGDPLFVQRAASDYRLATNSPCVNAGTNLAWMAGETDLDGEPRVAGPAVDMGAYELGAFRCHFCAMPARGVNPLTVDFEGWVAGTNAETVYYRWDFGDGGGGIEGWGSNEVTRVYTNSGLYRVSLEASNAVGDHCVLAQEDCVAVAQTNICHVSSAGGNVFPYDTWANAAWAIQDAVDACLPGGQVLVTNGTYDPFVHVRVTNAIRVTSVNGPTGTIIDGKEISRGFYVDHSNAFVDGFTITNGNPIYPLQRGGGVWIQTGGTVSNCVITGCQAYFHGGGAYCDSGGLVTDCELVNNCSHWYGGGGACENGGEFLRCVIRDNEAPNYHGGGFYIANTGTVRACVIESNRTTYASGGYGGGVFCEGNGGLIENCWIRGNSGVWLGGGVFVSSAARGARVRNCAIVGNTIQHRGGGVYGGVLQNCTVIDNAAGETGGGTQESSNRNCIVYYNTASGQVQNVVSGACTYTCTWPNPGGTGNIDASPWLISQDNVRLLSNSPCINAGSNALSAGAVDLFGMPRTNNGVVDMGCVEFQGGSLTGAIQVAVAADYTNAVLGYGQAFQGILSGEIAGYAWDFGDGTETSGVFNVSHTYGGAAYYPLVLRAWNDGGMVSATVRVHIVTGYTNYAATTGTPQAPYTNWAQAARTIQDAIDANTYAGSRVMVGDGVYTQGGFSVSGVLNRVHLAKPLTVSAVNARQAVVRGGTDTRCAYVGGSGRLEGLALVNGMTSTNGDGIYGSGGGGVLLDNGGSISNCLVAGNWARQGGGVFCSQTGNVHYCEIVSNRSLTFGGGVYCAQGGAVEHCRVVANVCSNTTGSCYGGGLFATNGGVIQSTLFSNNVARSEGGGAYILRGKSVVFSDCVLAYNVAGGSGGGVYLSTTSLVSGCDIVGNRSIESSGGGIYLYEAGTVSNCTIRGNEAGSSGAGLYSGRAGMAIECVFSDNETPFNGGGAYLYDYCSAVDCDFTENRAGQNGGGLYLGGNNTITSRNCRMEGNVASNSGGGIWHASNSQVDSCVVRSNTAGRGGGMYSYYGEVRNCLIAANTATNQGGGQFATYVTEQNCTLSGNVASNSGGGLCATNRCALTNVIIYGNTAAASSNILLLSTNCTFAYCLSAPLPSGTGNLDQNPLFAGAGDYHLATNSPGINSGTNQPWMATGVDLDENPRLAGDRVDLGAYEYQGTVLEVTPGTQSVGRAAGSTTFAVTNAGIGTMRYAATTSAGWLHLGGNVSGTNGGTLAVSYDANTVAAVRTGTVTVTAAGAAGNPAVVKVVQAGAEATLQILPATTNLAYGAATGRKIAVTANGAWTAARGANSTWITVTGGASGNGNGTVTYSVAAYDGASTRTGTVVVAGGGITRTHTVKQTAPPRRVDLVMKNVVVTRPSSAAARTFASCRFDVQNKGPAAGLGTLKVEYYLSKDTTFGNADDVKIGETSFASQTIGAGATKRFTLTSTQLGQMVKFWTVALTGPASYYVFAKATSTTTEAQAADNRGRTSGKFSYTGGAWVDLSVKSLRATRPSSTASRKFTACSFQIYNRGPVLRRGTVKVEFFLSNDTTFGDADDRNIGDTTFTGLSIAAGAGKSVSLNATRLLQMTRRWTTSLAASGSYYLFARVSCSTATETKPSDNQGRTTSKFRYTGLARSGKLSGLEAGGAAWARAGENQWVAAPELIDGDPETVWTGARAGPWAVAVDLGGTIPLAGLDIEYATEPWEAVNVLGTEDLLEWFDLTAITNLPVKCRAVFFDFQGSGDGKAPALGEIGWE